MYTQTKINNDTDDVWPLQINLNLVQVKSVTKHWLVLVVKKM